MFQNIELGKIDTILACIYRFSKDMLNCSVNIANVISVSRQLMYFCPVQT